MARRKNTAEAFEILYRLAEERRASAGGASAPAGSGVPPLPPAAAASPEPAGSAPGGGPPAAFRSTHGFRWTHREPLLKAPAGSRGGLRAPLERFAPEDAYPEPVDLRRAAAESGLEGAGRPEPAAPAAPPPYLPHLPPPLAVPARRGGTRPPPERPREGRAGEGREAGARAWRRIAHGTPWHRWLAPALGEASLPWLGEEPENVPLAKASIGERLEGRVETGTRSRMEGSPGSSGAPAREPPEEEPLLREPPAREPVLPAREPAREPGAERSPGGVGGREPPRGDEGEPARKASRGGRSGRSAKRTPPRESRAAGRSGAARARGGPVAAGGAPPAPAPGLPAAAPAAPAPSASPASPAAPSRPAAFESAGEAAPPRSRWTERLGHAFLGTGGKDALGRRVELRVGTLAMLLLATVIVALIVAASILLPEGDGGRAARSFQDLPWASGAAGFAGREGPSPRAPGPGAVYEPLPRRLPYWGPDGLRPGGVRPGGARDGTGAEGDGAPRPSESAGKGGAGEGGADEGVVLESLDRAPGSPPAPPPAARHWMVLVRSNEDRRGGEAIQEYFRANLGVDCVLEAQAPAGRGGSLLYRVWLDRRLASKEEADDLVERVCELGRRKVFKSHYFLDALAVERSP